MIAVSGGEAAMAAQLLKVRRESVAACMTCPLCDKLLLEATTISLCLHTFCRKCIYEKLSDDEVDTCPVCEIYLGCNPMDKLRPDNNLQDIRAMIFPTKKRTLKAPDAPEAVPSVSPPAKRKERSLSSLVVSTPRVPVHTSPAGRRTRAGARKSSALRGTSPSIEEHPKEEGSVEDHTDRPSCHENQRKTIQNNKLGPCAKSSNDQIPNEDEENCSGPWDGKVDLWKPLNCLVEAANRTKFSKSISQGPPHVKAEPSPAQGTDSSAATHHVEENGHIKEARDDRNNIPSVPASTKRKRIRSPNRKMEASPGKSSNSKQIVVNVMRHHRQNVPIWFSLVASEDWDGAAHLPQISSGFLRIKDSGMPVSSIQKYIAKKLELSSEEEVQISCQGQPVLPTLKLSDLLDLWLRTAPASRRVKANVGNSGRDYVMVLSYSRKSLAQAPVSAHLLQTTKSNNS